MLSGILVRPAAICPTVRQMPCRYSCCIGIQATQLRLLNARATESVLPPSFFAVRAVHLGFPPGRCRPKQHLPGTFSPCLLLQPLYGPFPPVFLFPVGWKVPGKSPFLHHLLDFVINRPASEASLAGPDPDPCPEGADKSVISPAPAIRRRGYGSRGSPRGDACRLRAGAVRGRCVTCACGLRRRPPGPCRRWRRSRDGRAGGPGRG